MISESFVGGGDDEIEYFGKVFFGKGFEDADFVKTIEKFRLEFTCGDEGLGELFFDGADRGVIIDLLSYEVGAGVGCSNDD